MLALFAVLLFGGIAMAMVFAAGAATRASGTMLGTSRALAAAESAAWKSIETFDWQAALNLMPGQFLGVPQPGGSDYSEVFIMRLDSTSFFVQASAGNRAGSAGNARFIRRVGVTIEVLWDSTGVVRPVRVPQRAWTELF